MTSSHITVEKLSKALRGNLGDMTPIMYIDTGVYFLTKGSSVVYCGSGTMITRVKAHMRDKIIDFDGVRFIPASLPAAKMLETLLIPYIPGCNKHMRNYVLSDWDINMLKQIIDVEELEA